MNDFVVTVEQEEVNPFAGRPHVVILGAGASVAAFPRGDRYGRLLPVMDDLIEKLGLVDDLEKHAVPYHGRNFEDLYSDIVDEPKLEELVSLLEKRIAGYFAGMRLPEEPTIYDYLVLSLRPKDVIATFNWDPFLYDACCRNYKVAPLPHVVYLHGNVRIGYCFDDKTKGMIGSCCSKCGSPFTPSKLLFPVRHKDYVNDPFISGEWASLKHYLEAAFVLTIFGYSAPKTDTEAVNLMKLAWGETGARELEEIEIIDIKKPDVLRSTWDAFIHTHHYETAENFFDSWIAKHPRRTCEAMWNQLLEAKFVSDNDVPRGISLAELQERYKRLVSFE